MIAEVKLVMTTLLEAHDLDSAEELVHDLIEPFRDHPSILSDPDPLVRARRVGWDDEGEE